MEKIRESPRTFYLPITNLQIDYDTFVGISVEATLNRFYDKDRFHMFDDADEAHEDFSDFLLIDDEVIQKQNFFRICH